MQPGTITCWQCQAEHPEAHHARIVYNRTPLYGPWAGWRMAGRDLISPDGDRINPRRLAGILWAEKSRARSCAPELSKRCETLTIVRLPARERFAGSA